MIYSMTAFARNQKQSDLGTFTLEIRTINHRFLEISINLPDMLRFLEMTMRDKIRTILQRGKIDCTLRYQPSASKESILNINLAKALCQASEEIVALLRSPAAISATDILRLPGVLEAKTEDVSSLQKEMEDLLNQTLQDLVSVREREGQALAKLFLQRVDGIEKQIKHVRSRAPNVLSEHENRIRKRFADLKLEVDHDRLEQEMVYMVQRFDIAEELDRAQTHIEEFRRLIKAGGTVGRRLDFLLQELNREANTLGSKSNDSDVTHAAVEMKVLIEQIREQVQNVE